ncbi:hypothetical protein ACOSQ3_026211 [Xanthoceras sorbifolium]
MVGGVESTAQRRLVRRQMRSSRCNEAGSVGVGVTERESLSLSYQVLGERKKKRNPNVTDRGLFISLAVVVHRCPEKSTSLSPRVVVVILSLFIGVRDGFEMISSMSPSLSPFILFLRSRRRCRRVGVVVVIVLDFRREKKKKRNPNVTDRGPFVFLAVAIHRCPEKLTSSLSLSYCRLSKFATGSK